jgi:N6-adenosine-specific RNA methylase IME4
MSELLPFHPAAGIFDLLEGDEFETLCESVRDHGLKLPIYTARDEDTGEVSILDGRNRYRACLEVSVEPRFEEWDGRGLAVDFVWLINAHRRQLTTSQKQIAAARYAIEHEKEARQRRGRRTDLTSGSVDPEVNFGRSREQAAEKFGVPEMTVRRAISVVKSGSPGLISAVEHGDVSVSAAADVARLPKSEQEDLVARGESEILDAAKAIRQRKAEERRAELATVAAIRLPPPPGRYSTIVIDPPWPMEKIERDVRPRQVAFEYPTMSEDDLKEFSSVVNGMAHDECHLFMWTTNKFLPMSFRLLEAWGFRYVLTMVWHKSGGFQPIGLPQYNCEFVLYARRGSPKFVDTKAFNCCFEAPRREHSRKPDEFYDLVRRVTDGSRIDVFSREKREGFDQYGNEADKFEEAAS